MDIETTKKYLIELVREINNQNPSVGLGFHQQDVSKKNMCVEGCNGKLWIEPMREWFDVSLSGQSLTIEKTPIMLAEFGLKHGNKQSKPEPSHQPYWRVYDFESVVRAVYLYADIKRAERSHNILPEEITDLGNYYEGAVKSISVNVYERNQRARKECINHYGYLCSICGFDFEEKYGEIGKKFIHIHHMVPISEIGKEYKLDPINDLLPLCPNCHSMVHRKQPPFSVEEIKNFIKTNENT